MKKRYTVYEVADILKVDKRTIYRDISEGNLKAAKVGREFIITSIDIENYLGKDRAHLLFDEDNNNLKSKS